MFNASGGSRGSRVVTRRAFLKNGGEVEFLKSSKAQFAGVRLLIFSDGTSTP